VREPFLVNLLDQPFLVIRREHVSVKPGVAARAKAGSSPMEGLAAVERVEERADGPREVLLRIAP
jgi:hypothetical protein